jgi:uncharacterized protein (UPF0264 family)
MMKLLVSVRSVEEALLAARGGADFIDLKEPGAGALGGLPVATIRSIVAALRARGITLPVSATIGDFSMSALSEIGARVETVAACGVDFVKVGIEATAAAPAVLEWLGCCGNPVIPVFIADRGLDEALIEQAAALQFSALMVDTADKLAGCLFDVATPVALHRFIAIARGAGAQGNEGPPRGGLPPSGGQARSERAPARSRIAVHGDPARKADGEPLMKAAWTHTMAGLAGALRIEHAALLAALAPDFAGFRSAVCAGNRSSTLDPQRLHRLVQALRPHHVPTFRSVPSSSKRMCASSVR